MRCILTHVERGIVVLKSGRHEFAGIRGFDIPARLLSIGKRTRSRAAPEVDFARVIQGASRVERRTAADIIAKRPKRRLSLC